MKEVAQEKIKKKRAIFQLTQSAKLKKKAIRMERREFSIRKCYL
jgi:hypothetical protein